MKNEIASPPSVPSSIRNTPAALSQGPQITPQTVSPSRSLSVKFCWATRPAATQRPSSREVAGAGRDFTVAFSVPTPSTRVNVIVGGAEPPTIENEACVSSAALPSMIRKTVAGSSQGPHTTPVNVVPRAFRTYVLADGPAPDTQVLMAPSAAMATPGTNTKTAQNSTRAKVPGSIVPGSRFWFSVPGSGSTCWSEP